MKKVLLLIVSLVFFESIIAQHNTHWPEFNSNNFVDQDPVVAFVKLDGSFVTASGNWADLEVAAFVGDECRGHAFMANHVDEGDPYPIIELVTNYNNLGEAVTFQMFDHVLGIEYTNCSVNQHGVPVTVHTGEDNTQLYFDYDDALVLSFTNSGVGNAPTGAVNGLFSVSENTQVYFSQGNLQYRASTDTWRFAEHQWDYVGDDNSNISQTYSGWIDLFGWGTSGWDCGNTYYHPYDYITSNGLLYGPPDNNNLTGEYANSDWGVYNAISNGGNQVGLWRTLTREEWNYVFYNRTTSSGKRFAKAKVNDIPGLVLLPDNWNTSVFNLNNVNNIAASFNVNTITLSQWVTLEQAGAIFLPAAGKRYGTSVSQAGSECKYWSSSDSNFDYAYYLTSDIYSFPMTSGCRHLGYSVRLVHSVQNTSMCLIQATPNPANGGMVSGGGSYQAGTVCTLTATAKVGYFFTNWTKNGYVISTEPSYSFTVTEDAEYVANFECVALGEFTYMTPTNNYPFTSLPIRFSWDEVSGAEYYDLYVWDASGQMPTEPFAANLRYGSYSTTALQNYHTYNWFVKAKNACDELSSSVKSFSLDITPSLNVNVSNVDFGEVAMNQSVSTTLNVTGVVLENMLNVQITGDDAAMFSYIKASGWDDYNGGILIVTFNPTTPQYSYNANLEVNSGTFFKTTALTGTVSNLYVFNTTVDEDVYAMNSEIPIHGTLTDWNNAPVADAEVEIGVFVMGMKRTLQAVTNNNGQFSAVFEPMPSESGYYTVNSGRPGNNSTVVHDDFNIPGMAVVASDYILCAVTQDQPKTDSILIRNKSNLPLNNIQVTTLLAPDGCSVSSSPLSLGGLEEDYLFYTVAGSTLTQGYNYQELRLKVISDEGAEKIITIWYYCMAAKGVLDVAPQSIVTTMTKGQSKIMDVMLTNNGTAATGDITIDLPDVEWMSVVGSDTLPSLAVNDTAYFSLRFSPDDDIPLVQYSGTIAINSGRGDFVSLPYVITAVSDSTGMLVVDVTDDYTWNTNNGNGPHLANAEVTLKGYYSLETVAQGYTDENGLFQVDDLPEGYYRIHVEADHHSQYDNNILVTAGETNNQNIYLQYQGITYSWTVVPTEIEDEYTFELNVVYETNVPVPVVVIEAPKQLPEFEDTYTFNYVITNHGLIDAYNLELHVPNSEDFLFTPLYDNVDTLKALTTIVVPCVVTHIDNGLKLLLRDDCAEWGYTWAQYEYTCHGKKNQSSGFVYTLLGSKPCGTPPSTEGNGGGDFYAPLLGIVGGNYHFPFPSVSSPLLEIWYECEHECFDLLGNFILTGVQLLPGVGTIATIASTLYDIYKGNIVWSLWGVGNVIVKEIFKKETIGKAMTVFEGLVRMKDDAVECFRYLTGGGRNIMDENLLFVPVEVRNALLFGEEYFGIYDSFFDGLEMFFGDTAWLNSNIDELSDFMETIIEYDSLYGHVTVDAVLLSKAPSNITDDQVYSFVDRCNNTMDIIDGQTIISDNYMPIDSLYAILSAIFEIDNESKELGFESAEDRLMHYYNEAIDYMESSNSSSVCAKITVQFSQKMTMTREAFEGTFTVHNGHDSESMEAIGLNFIVKDEDGNDCTNLFQINTLSLNNITGIDGYGSLGAGMDGVAKIQFIPTKQAAPTEPKVYFFGGTFSFVDPYTSDELVYDLYPVDLTVHPSPDLYVDYFMQRDILGDDALTLDRVEPSIPAELAVIINNKGAGVAKNVTLETAEPEIVDNDKGLAIDFAMYGASFNGNEAQLGLMSIPFGNIESGQTAVGEWLFTSSLLGHFVSYEANVIHNNSYGNPDLSLVSHLDIHELIHPIYAYGNLDDGINDFLVNDDPDAYDMPDTIYFSHGGKTAVGIVDDISFDHYVTPQDTIVTLSINPSRIGWNYGITDDPGMDKYELVSCVRTSDNQVIPLNNVWQTFVTIPDESDPIYENKLHIVDTLSNDAQNFTYILVYRLKSNLLDVEEIAGIPENPIDYPLETFTVIFNEAIIDSTFTYEDMTLKCQNGPNLMNESVVITKVSDSIFDINISGLTNETGLYVLNVSTLNIQDARGYYGYNGKQASWVQVLDDTYVVTAMANPEDGGMVTGAGIFEEGDVCTLVATANTGYVFTNWTKNGTEVSTNATYSFTVTETSACIANFTLNTYNVMVEADPSEGGTVTGTGSYQHGSTLTVTVTPNSNYHLDYWTKDGVVVSEDLSYTFIVTGDCQMVAHLSFYEAVNENGVSTLLLYPNPAKNKLNLRGASMQTVRVYNATGQIVITKECNNNENEELDVSSLASGLYMVFVRAKDGMLIKKNFVKK